MFIQIVHLPGGSSCRVSVSVMIFHVRIITKESHVEAYLVVARTGRPMRNGICAYFVGIASASCLLGRPFGTYGWISAVTQHIAEYHVFQGSFRNTRCVQVIYFGTFNCRRFLRWFSTAGGRNHRCWRGAAYTSYPFSLARI